MDRIAAITGKRPPFYQIDLRNRTALDDIFQKHSISAAIHFAGLKAVGESVAEPLRYYENNIESTISLCFVMAARGVKRLIFSSSATVYGDPHTLPIREDFPLAPANPYGRTKLMIEQILQDLHAADPGWQIALLRYFNPVGAHSSGLIGEDPGGYPNNLMPYISQVAVGRRERLSVFGSDYPTPDGTCVRDYLHVHDLALAHVTAAERLTAGAPVDALPGHRRLRDAGQRRDLPRHAPDGRRRRPGSAARPSGCAGGRPGAVARPAAG